MDQILAAAREVEVICPSQVAESFSEGVFILHQRSEIDKLMNANEGILWSDSGLRSLASVVFDYGYWLVANANEYDSPKSNNRDLDDEEIEVIADLRNAIKAALANFS